MIVKQPVENENQSSTCFLGKNEQIKKSREDRPTSVSEWKEISRKLCCAPSLTKDLYAELSSATGQETFILMKDISENLEHKDFIFVRGAPNG